MGDSLRPREHGQCQMERNWVEGGIVRHRPGEDMSENPEALAERCESALASLLGLAFHLLESLKFGRRNPQQLWSVSLFSRLAGLTSGCKALLDARALVGVPTLLRNV